MISSGENSQYSYPHGVFGFIILIDGKEGDEGVEEGKIRVAILC